MLRLLPVFRLSHVLPATQVLPEAWRAKITRCALQTCANFYEHTPTHRESEHRRASIGGRAGRRQRWRRRPGVPPPPPPGFHRIRQMTSCAHAHLNCRLRAGPLRTAQAYDAVGSGPTCTVRRAVFLDFIARVLRPRKYQPLFHDGRIIIF